MFELHSTEGDHESSSITSDPVKGRSAAILEAKALVERAKDLRILFWGETGVGKTPFARYSHWVVDRQYRRKRPFEQVNSACLTPEQFQDQLFGHRRGAFTGAILDKKGLVEIARGGDLFLDEIGDMPLETQAHFLTFLDTMEYYPLGEDKKRVAEVRILCATNQDLKKLVEQGRFRRDLYSRISQVVVPIPPLRQRREDISCLFEHFVESFCGFKKPYDPAIVAKFENYCWREGNVRELRDAVECLCLLSEGAARIELSHLGDRYRANEYESQLGEATAYRPNHLSRLSEITQIGLEGYLAQVEKQLLEDIVSRHQGSLELVAKQLGLSRPTLYRRLKKYSILSARALSERFAGVRV